MDMPKGDATKNVGPGPVSSAPSACVQTWLDKGLPYKWAIRVCEDRNYTGVFKRNDANILKPPSENIGKDLHLNPLLVYRTNEECLADQEAKGLDTFRANDVCNTLLRSVTGNSSNGPYDGATFDLNAVREDDDFLIVPIQATCEGVHNGAYKSKNELKKSFQFFENRPITILHPPGRGVVATNEVHGLIKNTKLGDGNSAWRGEAWFFKNTSMLKSLGHDDASINAHKGMLDAFRAGGRFDGSIGYWHNTINEAGSFNGVKYDRMEVNIYPDHFAVVDRGASPWAAGTGFGQASDASTNAGWMCGKCRKDFATIKDLEAHQLKDGHGDGGIKLNLHDAGKNSTIVEGLPAMVMWILMRMYDGSKTVPESRIWKWAAEFAAMSPPGAGVQTPMLADAVEAALQEAGVAITPNAGFTLIDSVTCAENKSGPTYEKQGETGSHYHRSPGAESANVYEKCDGRLTGKKASGPASGNYETLKTRVMDSDGVAMPVTRNPDGRRALVERAAAFLANSPGLMASKMDFVRRKGLTDMEALEALNLAGSGALMKAIGNRKGMNAVPTSTAEAFGRSLAREGVTRRRESGIITITANQVERNLLLRRDTGGRGRADLIAAARRYATVRKWASDRGVKFAKSYDASNHIIDKIETTLRMARKAAGATNRGGCPACSGFGMNESDRTSRLCRRCGGTGEAPSKNALTDVSVRLTGEDGNAFAVLGAVRKAMKRAGVAPETIAAYMAEAMQGDYDHLLRTTMKYVNVNSDAGGRIVGGVAEMVGFPVPYYQSRLQDLIYQANIRNVTIPRDIWGGILDVFGLNAGSNGTKNAATNASQTPEEFGREWARAGYTRSDLQDAAEARFDTPGRPFDHAGSDRALRAYDDELQHLPDQNTGYVVSDETFTTPEAAKAEVEEAHRNGITDARIESVPGGWIVVWGVNTRNARPLLPFNQWLQAVDRVLEAEYGLGHQDLPDAPWMDSYEVGLSPVMAARAYISEGWAY